MITKIGIEYSRLQQQQGLEFRELAGVAPTAKAYTVQPSKLLKLFGAKPTVDQAAFIRDQEAYQARAASAAELMRKRHGNNYLRDRESLLSDSSPIDEKHLRSLLGKNPRYYKHLMLARALDNDGTGQEQLDLIKNKGLQAFRYDPEYRRTYGYSPKDGKVYMHNEEPAVVPVGRYSEYLKTIQNPQR